MRIQSVAHYLLDQRMSTLQNKSSKLWLIIYNKCSFLKSLREDQPDYLYNYMLSPKQFDVDSKFNPGSPVHEANVLPPLQ